LCLLYEFHGHLGVVRAHLWNREKTSQHRQGTNKKRGGCGWKRQATPSISYDNFESSSRS
jgi:hypothetical protein